jgi:hypothetical protein
MTDPYEARLRSLGLRTENAERMFDYVNLDRQKMGS